MDAPPPDDFDPYREYLVNYGQQGNGTSKVVWWVMGGIMVIQAGISVSAITFVGGALYDMNARLAVVESRLSECRK
jgi:hypothetical protein